MNLLDHFQPLPQGTTTATLRRFSAIKEHIQQVSELTVRVFAVESAAALRHLLQTNCPNTVVHVYVYPLKEPKVEVTLLQDGKESHIKTCNIDQAGDILQVVPVDETSRRQWRELIRAYVNEPYLVDVPTPETNHLFHRWMTTASTVATIAVLMDDLIDAVLAMLEAKSDHLYDDAYVVQTTAVAGVRFAASVQQWSESKLTQKLTAAKLAFGPNLPVTAELTAALEAFVWENQ